MKIENISGAYFYLPLVFTLSKALLKNKKRSGSSFPV